MSVEEKENIEEKLIELLRSGNKADIRAYINDIYPQDLADIFKNLSSEDELNCFLLLDLEHAGELLAELSYEKQKNLLNVLGYKQLAPVVSQMDIDDATNFLSRLEEEEKVRLLEILPDPIQQEHLKELIHYPEESAGRIMSTTFLRLRSDMTINTALVYVRNQSEKLKSTIYYLYVVNNLNVLVGVISLRDIICTPLTDTVEKHMNTEVITCNISDDRETVAKAISKYDLLAIPIVDNENVLKGIVTVDDVVDVLKEETTEDIYQVSGISDAFTSDELISGKVTYAVRGRLPWLLLTLCGQAIAAFIIASHDKTISSVPIAISFMPLLSGLSGNVGGQTSTIIVRGLITGDIELKNTIKHIFHELKIGLLLGIICSTFTGIIAWLQYEQMFLGLIVAFALTIAMISGVLLGTIFPIVLQYLKKDPAAACSPVITTLLDIFTFSFYLKIVSLSIHNLH